MKPLKDMSVFDLEINDKVFNSETEEIGRIVSIRETQYECIDAFILWPNSQKETVLNMHHGQFFLVKD